MRLKKSPKEAIRIIDKLIQGGIKIMDWIRSEDWDQHKNPIVTSLEEYHALRKATNKPTKLEDLEFFSSKCDEWSKACLKELKGIFLDVAPVYSFRNASPTNINKEDPHGDYVALEASLESKLNVLVKYYDQVSSFIRSPLVYLPEKAQIWFYDFLVQLEPDSNEASLCSFMFDFGIGELKEFEDIYAHIKGESIEESHSWPKGWRATLNNAYDGINKKTNKKLGFSVLSKSKNQLSVNFPNRFIKGIS